MQKNKDFKNTTVKKRGLKQLFNYFSNRFGTDDVVKPKKDRKDFVKAVVKEDLKDEFLNNKDIK